jgi:ABC-type polysaccharide/polyol phosphate transport system ATPase subunit
MLAIKQLCKKALLLEKGSIKMMGDVNDVIEKYNHLSSEKK